MITVVENFKRRKTFEERTRVHAMQLRVNELRREIDQFENVAKTMRVLGGEGGEQEAARAERKLPALRAELKTAEHHLDVAATEEAKIQHDEAMEAERLRELDEFYAEERANAEQCFEAWRKRKGSPRR